MQYTIHGNSPSGLRPRARACIFHNTLSHAIYIYYIYPTWGLYHSNWVRLNYHKRPCLEGTLTFILDLHGQKEASYLLARAGHIIGGAH